MKKIELALLIFGICFSTADLPSQVAIGAILRPYPILQETFRIAIENINSDPNLLPNTKLVPVVETVSLQFDVISAVCNLIDRRVISIIGPLVSSYTKTAQIVCGQLGIPQISILASDSMLSTEPILNESSSTLLMMSPPDIFQNRALIDILRYYGWTSFAVLTEDSEQAIHASMELQTLAMKYEIRLVIIQRFRSSDPKTFNITSHLYNIKEKNVRVIILQCPASLIRNILRQAENMDMLRSGWVWLVMDAVTTNGLQYLSDDGYIPSSLLGLIGTAYVVPKTSLFFKLLNTLKQKGFESELTYQKIFTRVYDAVLAIAYGFHQILYIERASFELPSFQTQICSHSSNSIQTWKWGRYLLQAILKLNDVNGTLGPLKFTEFGYYQLTNFDIANLQTKGFVTVGKWVGDMKNFNISSDIVFPGQISDPPNDSHGILQGKVLKIGIILEEPFIMRNIDYKDDDTKNLKYEGLLIDLLLKLQKMHEFKFNFIEVKQYGSKDEITKEWNGLVRQLMDKKIDLGLATLTISWERQEVISFTNPYYDLGMGLLMPKYNARAEDSYFAFLSPFESTVWFGIIISLIFTSIALALCVNLTPDSFKKRNQSNSRKNPEKASEVINPWFTFPQAIWWSFSSLVSPGTEFQQRNNLPTKIIMGTWWITTVVFIAAYTAKLAAFMTVQHMNQDIESIEDLVKSESITFGTLADSHISNFFANSHYEIYRIAYKMMKARKSFVNDSLEGINKVRESYSLPGGHKDRFAFIMDSPVLDYITQQKPCIVERVGRLFGLQNYGLGLPKDSPYEKQFSSSILKLREDGYLDFLNKRWFLKKCPDSKLGSEELQLGFKNLAGVFICFGGGILLAFLILAFLWIRELINKKKTSRIAIKSNPDRSFVS